jgi:hypothetical protein
VNLRRIIIEEIDDFQWMKDVGSNKPIDLTGKWVINNDRIEDDPYMVATQEKLFDLGFGWGGLGGFNRNVLRDAKGFKYFLGIAMFQDDNRLGYWPNTFLDRYDSEILKQYDIEYKSSEFLDSFNIITPFNK